MAGVMDAVKGLSGRRGFEWKNRTLKFVHRPLALGLVHHRFFWLRQLPLERNTCRAGAHVKKG